MEAQLLIELFAVLLQFLMVFPGVFRLAEDELLHLIEVMDPEEALGVLSMGADLPAEAWAQGAHFNGKIAFFQGLVHEHGCHGVLASGNQKQIFTLCLIHDGFEVP